MVEVAARLPLGALVAVGGHAAGLVELQRGLHQVPRHERGVALREVVVEPHARAVLPLVAVASARSRGPFAVVKDSSF